MPEPTSSIRNSNSKATTTSSSIDKHHEAETEAEAVPIINANSIKKTNTSHHRCTLVIRGLLDMLQRDDDDSFAATNQRLIRASMATVLVWAMATTAVMTILSSSSSSSSNNSSAVVSLEMASGVEREVCSIAFCLMLMSNISRCLPLVYRHRIIIKVSSTAAFNNGFFVTAMTVQVIALVANGLLAFVLTLVVIDPLTGVRVHLVRWAEWFPLSFLLTFLAEEVDVPTIRNRRIALLHALAQGFAALAGFTLPFLHNPHLYGTVFGMAVALYSTIFVRVYQKRQDMHETAASLAHMGYINYDSIQDYNRVRLCFRSLCELSCLWTLIVISHCVVVFVPRHLPPTSVFATPALPMILETICEVLSKHLHILVAESVAMALSEQSRSDQMLELLHRMMEVVWEKSSDAIAISSTDPDRRLCIISPAILYLTSAEFLTDDQLGIPPGEPVALVFEVPLIGTKTVKKKKDNGKKTITTKKRDNGNKTTTPTNHDGDDEDCAETEPSSNGSIAEDGNEETSKSSSSSKQENKERLPFSRLYYTRLRNEGSCTVTEKVLPIPISPHLLPNIEMVANLVNEAVQCRQSTTTLSKDFVSTTTTSRSSSSSSARQRPGQGTKSQEEEESSSVVVNCEVSVTKIDSSTVIMIFRDISERVMKFKAQKDLAVSSIEREKDEQTNRFTRHEVKNGLLSAIGLVDALKDHESCKKTTMTTGSSNNNNNKSVTTNLLDLDTTLHEVLDTVMAEAMTRDLTHGMYTPRTEQVDIHSLLRTTRSEEERFPVSVDPLPFPDFCLDPQLLRYIHRNAISNACKYGSPGGTVKTVAKYDRPSSILTVDIINEPGEHHERLVQLGERAAQEVFLPGRRLHSSYGLGSEKDSREVSVSSGDGAWIMHKCAHMLGGDVSITFNPERTIFNLSLFVHACAGDSEDDADSTDPNWETPPGTWGIVIDDSKVQLKLLDRLLDFLGVAQDHRLVLGHTADELLSFNDKVKELVELHKDSKFLIIADENLDIVESTTRHKRMSGSLCVERLLNDLQPSDAKRVLALVRSANDSSADLELYKKRSHGFLQKEPIRREIVKEKIRSFWFERFWFERFENATAEGSTPIARVKRSRKLPRSSSDDFLPSVTSTAELTLIVEAIDNLLLHQRDNWPAIHDKLQVLKGDTMTLINRRNPRVVAVLESLEEIRTAEEAPSNLESIWKLIRALITSLN